MKKVLVFGAGRDFNRDYTAFLNRHGFEADTFNKRRWVAGKLTQSPILLVFGATMKGRESDGLDLLLTMDRRLPVIFIFDGSTPMTPKQKSLNLRARYALPGKFLKKDLLSAVRGCSEVLELREKVDVLKGELKVKSNELSMVLDIGKALASSLELPKVLTKIMERMRSVVKAESWSVMLMDEDNKELVLEAAKGGAVGQKKRRVKLGVGIAGWTAQDKAPKLVPDVAREKRFSKEADRLPGVETRSVMAVPIISNGKLLGVIEMINREGGAGFSVEDLRLVSRLIDQTAVAIERGEMYKKMADLVITDDLTKLFNLRYLDRTLEVEIERAMRYNLSVSLIFMDIDYFKNVNDHFGHLVGSKLLVEVSQLLLRGLRRVDIVARYGGDEFVIVLPQTDVNTARVVAERLRKNIEKHVFMKSEGLALKLTASFGIACYPDHAGDREELMRLADEAMYRVKYQTRNSVYVVGT